jgi:hypothetical protein
VDLLCSSYIDSFVSYKKLWKVWLSKCSNLLHIELRQLAQEIPGDSMRRFSATRARFFCGLPAVLLLTGFMHADTIFSENFNTATVGLAVTTAGAFSAVNGTNVDVVGGGTFGYLCVAPTSGPCVDMGGSNGNNPMGDIKLTDPLNLAAGTYYLSFDLIGSQRGVESLTTVTFGSWSQTYDLASSDVTSGIVVNQAVTIAGGPTQLEFLDASFKGGNENQGALLDNIVISTASPVPEPGSLVLMATGLMGAAGVLRRRFQA